MISIQGIIKLYLPLVERHGTSLTSSQVVVFSRIHRQVWHPSLQQYHLESGPIFGHKKFFSMRKISRISAFICILQFFSGTTESKVLFLTKNGSRVRDDNSGVGRPKSSSQKRNGSNLWPDLQIFVHFEGKLG